MSHDDAAAGFADLGFARVDTDRARRTGDPEVVYGAGKTTEQIVAILRHLHEAHPERAILATRVADPAAVDSETPPGQADWQSCPASVVE